MGITGSLVWLGGAQEDPRRVGLSVLAYGGAPRRLRYGTLMLQTLDPASHLTCRRFLVTVAMLTIWSAAFSPNAVFAAAALLSSGCAALTFLVALLRRERFCGPSLNRWDEGVAFLVVHCLAQVLA